jgi:hypothetical protein
VRALFPSLVLRIQPSAIKPRHLSPIRTLALALTHRWIRIKLEGAGLGEKYWYDTPAEEWEYASPLNAYLSISGTAGGLASSAAQGHALLAISDPDETFTDEQERSEWA